MNFTNPWIWALLPVLAIPILVHLFDLVKVKKIYFSNLALLRQIQIQSDDARKIKRYLLLANRILIFLLLLFLFARPKFMSHVLNKPHISIFVDNSFSMSSSDDFSELLSSAIVQANAVIQEYGDRAIYHIMTQASNESQDRLVTAAQAKEVLRAIKPCGISKSYEEIYQKQVQILETHGITQGHLIWFTDAQYVPVNQKIKTRKNNFSLSLKHLSVSNFRNAFVDSLWMSSDLSQVGHPQRLYLKFVSSYPIQTSYQIKVNGQKKFSKTLQFDHEIIDSFVFLADKANWNNIKISIEDPEISYDNHAFASFFIQDNPKIALYAQKNLGLYYIKEALSVAQKNTLIECSSLAQPQDWQSMSLLILHQISSLTASDIQAIQTISSYGVPILLTLDETISVEQANSVFQSLALGKITQKNAQRNFLTQIQQNDYLFRDVIKSFKAFQSIYSIQNFEYQSINSKPNKNLATYQDGQPMISVFKFHPVSNLYWINASFNKDLSNFVTSALFSPIFHKFSFMAQNNFFNAYRLGREEVIDFYATEKLSQDGVFTLQKDSFSFIPNQKNHYRKLSITLSDEIQEPGHYILTQPKSKDTFYLSLNASKSEGLDSFLTESELINRLKSFDAQIDIKPLKSLIETDGVNSWNLQRFFWILLGFLVLLEMILMLPFQFFRK
ncbi:MAG: BatA domain-containing protein [Chitinophagales bacterium]|jgi:hypothetical protein|nr:BatA domain-containing protein [Chitinophagales bacterium]